MSYPRLIIYLKLMKLVTISLIYSIYNLYTQTNECDLIIGKYYSFGRLKKLKEKDSLKT